MEALLISVVVLFVLLIGGGLLVGSTKRARRNETMLEPSAPKTVAPTSTSTIEPDLSPEQVAEIEKTLEDAAVPEPLEHPRFRDRLGKARGLFGEYVGIIRGRSGIDAATWDDLEEALIRADVGVSTTTSLLD